MSISVEMVVHLLKLVFAQISFFTLYISELDFKEANTSFNKGLETSRQVVGFFDKLAYEVDQIDSMSTQFYFVPLFTFRSSVNC